MRWLLCASPAVYLVITGTATACSGRGVRGALLRVGPSLAVVLVAGTVDRQATAVQLVWLLVLATAWTRAVEGYDGAG
ncbi:hypothetical protein ABZZ20_01890 [Streptomyces sp. NPDC006430]|uniref:hypothetical protein n=1 Tax=Streptomyces sp. NPDC006430 TaxID=3154299 RepID=UPI00339DC0F6